MTAAHSPPPNLPASSRNREGEVLELLPGKVLELAGPPGSGLTRLGLALLAGVAGQVAFLDVRGWFCPLAAWESGIDPDRLVVVRCSDRQRWPKVAAALLEGMSAVYAEVPDGMSDALLRRLGALARARGAPAALRPMGRQLPSGLAYLRVWAEDWSWEGPEAGHGRLRGRRLVLRLSGKGVGGLERVIEAEDDGADAVRVVPRLAPASAGRAAG